MKLYLDPKTKFCVHSSVPNYLILLIGNYDNMEYKHISPAFFHSINRLHLTLQEALNTLLNQQVMNKNKYLQMSFGLFSSLFSSGEYA